MSEKKTKKLINKIRKGNHQAFKQLYDMYANYALRTAFAITRNKSDAADIVQETFIRVYRNINSFDIDKPFKPWFYRILVNECNRLLSKKEHKEYVTEAERIFDLLNKPIKGEWNTKDILYEGLSQLDESNRTFIVLKYLNGFTEKEIAEIYEMNINTVKSRLFQARKLLRKILGGEKDEGKLG